MKICPKCQQEHEKRGTYCSRVCANSRQWSEEDKEKKRKAAKDYLASLSEEEMKALKERSSINIIKCLKTRKSAGRAGGLDYILETHFDLLSWQSKRLRIILEQNLCCAECGISEWNGKAITLEVDHIDGDNKNNNRENLRGLCPNCHSQTDTWRGRNMKPKITRLQKLKLELEKSNAT